MRKAAAQATPLTCQHKPDSMKPFVISLPAFPVERLPEMPGNECP